MKVRITPGAILLLAVLLGTRSIFFSASIAAALLHETGHIAAAKALGIKLRCIELDITGARLFPARAIPSYKKEWLLAAAGPFASLLCGAAILAGNRFFAAFGTASLSLALFNLLPIRGFDGGRMLYALLAARRGVERARAVLFAGTYLSLLFLFALSACLLLRYGQNVALAVLSATLFAKLFLFAEGAS